MFDVETEGDRRKRRIVDDKFDIRERLPISDFGCAVAKTVAGGAVDL